MTTGGAGTEGDPLTSMPAPASCGPPTVSAGEIDGPGNGVGGATAQVVVRTLPSGRVALSGSVALGGSPVSWVGVEPGGWVGVEPGGQGRAGTAAGGVDCVGAGVESLARARAGPAVRVVAIPTAEIAARTPRTMAAGQLVAPGVRVVGDMTPAAYVTQAFSGAVPGPMSARPRPASLAPRPASLAPRPTQVP